MSAESVTPNLVELARHAIDAMNRGDLDAAMSYAAPDTPAERLAQEPG